MKIRKCRQKFICAIKVFMAILVTITIIFRPKEEPVNSDAETEKKEIVEVLEPRPWYFNNGSLRPRTGLDGLKLWPDQADHDRIVDQLMFVPKEVPRVTKKIFLENFSDRAARQYTRIFQDMNCPVSNCELVFNDAIADAVVFDNFITRVRKKSSAHQVWILYSLESPFFSGQVIQQRSVNWTASYRLDSDLVAPYDKWLYYREGRKAAPQERNYAKGKSKKVAWLVSNCRSKNKRLEYAKSLSKYIEVDIFGDCGDKVCLKHMERMCRSFIAKNYKFYLSFENANCRHYITEKFFKNALRQGVVPIVMGAPKVDYEKVAPKNSFIHVEDFPTPKHLANYLHFLDKNDDHYNAYFHWRGTGEFINTFFWCRLCAMLHADRPPHFYQKITHWWRNRDICRKNFWNETNGPRIVDFLKAYRKLP